MISLMFWHFLAKVCLTLVLLHYTGMHSEPCESSMVLTVECLNMVCKKINLRYLAEFWTRLCYTKKTPWGIIISITLRGGKSPNLLMQPQINKAQINNAFSGSIKLLVRSGQRHVFIPAFNFRNDVLVLNLNSLEC